MCVVVCVCVGGGGGVFAKNYCVDPFMCDRSHFQVKHSNCFPLKQVQYFSIWRMQLHYYWSLMIAVVNIYTEKRFLNILRVSDT